MANIRVTCPSCKMELEIDGQFEGQEVECGSCLKAFIARREEPRGGASGSGWNFSSGRGRGRDEVDDEPWVRSSGRSRRDDQARYEDDDDDYAPPPPRREPGNNDGVATASLVLGSISIPLACCCGPLGIFTGLGAIITGVLGLKSRNNQAMAIIGLVLGVLSLGIAGVSFLAGFGNALFNWFN